MKKAIAYLMSMLLLVLAIRITAKSVRMAALEVPLDKN
jgi:hypothetical protein